MVSSEQQLTLIADRLITHGTTPLVFETPFLEAWLDIRRRLPKVKVWLEAHLRRGAWLNPPSGFMAVPLGYYRCAIRGLFEQLPRLERRIVFLSVDPVWGQTLLSDFQLRAGSRKRITGRRSGRDAGPSNQQHQPLSHCRASRGSFGALQLVI